MWSTPLAVPLVGHGLSIPTGRYDRKERVAVLAGHKPQVAVVVPLSDISNYEKAFRLFKTFLWTT
jgi:hypothetical protein